MHSNWDIIEYLNSACAEYGNGKSYQWINPWILGNLNSMENSYSLKSTFPKQATKYAIKLSWINFYSKEISTLVDTCMKSFLSSTRFLSLLMTTIQFPLIPMSKNFHPLHSTPLPHLMRRSDQSCGHIDQKNMCLVYV